MNGYINKLSGDFLILWVKKSRYDFQLLNPAIMRNSKTLLVLFMLTMFLASCQYEMHRTTGYCYSYGELGGVYNADYIPVEQPKIVYDDVVYNGKVETVTDSTKPDERGNEEYAQIVENVFENVKEKSTSTFSVDVDKASYSNVRRMVDQKEMPPANAIRLEEMINYFEYDYPQPTDEHPFSITTEAATCPWNTNHQLVMVGLQGKEIPKEQFPSSNFVFLVDVSGSMEGEGRLPLVKTTLKLLVDQLRPDDKVSIVVYAGAAGMVLSPTSGDKKNVILNAINNLSAGGSTAGGEGIKLAYKTAEANLIENGNNRIVLCTDGDFNVGVSSETDLQSLIESERDKGIFLTVLGYGYGNYKDNKLEILADKGNGNYGYIDNKEEAEKMLVTEMSGTLYTIAKDVKVQVDFDPEIVKSYRLLGYENRVLQDWEFNDDKRDAGEIGAGHTVTAIYEVELVNPAISNDMLTVKFRYKQPKAAESVLIEKPLNNPIQAFELASENLRFASCVAAYGMIMRNSAYKGNADLNMVMDIAQKSMTFDQKGYRADFIKLIESSKKILPVAYK